MNDKDVYEKLKHKVASAQHTNGEVLEPNFLQRDLKPAQIVSALTLNFDTSLLSQDAT